MSLAQSLFRWALGRELPFSTDFYRMNMIHFDFYVLGMIEKSFHKYLDIAPSIIKSTALKVSSFSHNDITRISIVIKDYQNKLERSCENWVERD